MFTPLRNQAYRNLFSAQVIALVGTGMATVALGLLAHDLAGANSGEVLGIALAIKMVAYIAVAPFASALAANIPRKTLLVSLDVVRAGVAAALPFVTEAWQVYGLMTVLYVASAAFTPAFQSMIPDILIDEREYTKALSLSRLASDLESVASPVLAVLLLGLMTYNNLFVGTAFGFIASALLVMSALLPLKAYVKPKPFLRRLTTGFWQFVHTPRLRGLLAISLATAAGGAMVFVNTVAIVQTDLRLGSQEVAWALAVFGSGSMLTALLLPRLLDWVSDRSLMVWGGASMAIALVAGAFYHSGYGDLLVIWFVMGMGYSMTLIPAGRVLRRSSSAVDRPALFAAQFALSHACWLVTYPLAGFLSARADTPLAFGVLAMLCASGVGAALLLWPAHDPDIIPHSHDDLASDDPHLRGDATEHAHAFVIDELHPRWPRQQD